MREFDDTSISDAVVERFSKTPDARLKQLVTSFTRHFHDFVREVEPTFDEWLYAIQFLSRTGQISVNGRQEFILLSDVFGISMLVDAINHRLPEGATATTVLGPFHVRAPPMKDGADISHGVAGVPVYVEVEICSADGRPLVDATVDVWQSDDDGFYDIQRPELAGATNLRGEFKSDRNGKVRFWSITPTAYPIPHDGPVGDLLMATARHPWRPAHLHFMISVPGHETLVTHIFVNGDQYLESDAVFGVKKSLVHDFPFRPPGLAPDGRQMDKPWRRMSWKFGLKQNKRAT
jgi:hydroxyquinol 1,2-dioxygenase